MDRPDHRSEFHDGFKIIIEFRPRIANLFNIFVQMSKVILLCLLLGAVMTVMASIDSVEATPGNKAVRWAKPKNKAAQ